MRLRFLGVRGSTPAFSAASVRYGGNTASVVLEGPNEEPLLFDLGTGVRAFGSICPMDGSFAGTALVTHIHWDHIQGLPFFAPLHMPGSRLDVFGPHQERGSLGDVFDQLMRPPYFPVRYTELGGEVRFVDVTADTIAVGSRKVTVRPVPHKGPTVGYRVEGSGASVAYISDHQAPPSLDTIAASVLELADGVDVLIHDAQYTRAQFDARQDWGHCTLDYALLVAREAGAKRLVLFHHDPSHTDDDLDRLTAELQDSAAGSSVEVIAAREGLELDLTVT
ncbi:MAG TPA: MBL fold metallo-hydrolase [Jatrophihabitantaceae bacterium]|jgi:phosphoribosyl 1,2-cyclic phosphodiesterase|nr:MBL fold metallo-hydrolase [Jatrophihabitantaceae bacterium]